MSGQGSMSNAFSGKFYLGYGPNGINLLCNQNHVDSDDSSSEEMRSELNIALGNSYLTNGPSATVEATSSALPHNIDLNAAYEGNDFVDTQELGGGLDTDKNAPANDSSNSNTIVISSGIAGYVLEDNEGGEDSASGGRRLSCKRRAPEEAPRQLSLGESSRSVKQGEIPQENTPGSLNLPSPVNNHPNAGYSGQLGGRISVRVGPAPALYQPTSAAGSGVVTGAGTSSEMNENSSVVGRGENSQRNIRLRRSASQSDSVSDHNLSPWATSNPHVQSPVFDQIIHLPSSSAASPMQSFMHTLNSSQTLQPFQWNGVTRARTSGPSTYALNGGNTLDRDQNVRNDPRSDVYLPEFQITHMPHLPANLHFADGRNFPGTISPISQNGSSSHQPPPPTWFAQGNMEEQYPGRMPDMVDGTEPQGQVYYCPFHMGTSPAARERELLEGSDVIMSSQMPLRAGLEIRSETQIANREMALRALTAVQRRNRLAAEVRNALALVRRRSPLPFGDPMLFNYSALFVDSDDEDDELEDMRLDVENMSYEQLLALEDQMGNVSTGLSEDAIVANLKRWKYQAVAEGSNSEDEPCCICQEEYADEDDLGKLRCGHDFHFNCIKKWLVEKNNCPICKKTAADALTSDLRVEHTPDTRSCSMASNFQVSHFQFHELLVHGCWKQHSETFVAYQVIDTDMELSHGKLNIAVTPFR
ncbi:unnamed protein product [Dovyalis caffra]|uniref:RING-type E3 ubiquitin transferase n=1 Tax=Dovyalis caffra TaxID=77055 RepID=A0AAV1RPM5_9ROSI|nr:unnamed protein product [Dovyalis caffra]